MTNFFWQTHTPSRPVRSFSDAGQSGHRRASSTPGQISTDTAFDLFTTPALKRDFGSLFAKPKPP